MKLVPRLAIVAAVVLVASVAGTATAGGSVSAVPAGAVPTGTAGTPAFAWRVTIRAGRVVGGVQRFRARKGQRIVLTVVSNLADEVHLHGYDLSRLVKPGTPARIAFSARLTGRFEVELERRGLRIAEFEVRS